MNKVKIETSIIKHVHFPSVILCFACCVLNACSSGEESIEGTLSSVFNLYMSQLEKVPFFETVFRATYILLETVAETGLYVSHESLI